MRSLGDSARKFRFSALAEGRQRLLFVSSLTAIAALPVAVTAANTVSVKLDGEIGRECSIRSGGATKGIPALDAHFDVGDVTKPGTKDFGFTVDCNTPFEYRLEAQYGALMHKTIQAAPRGFLNAVPYDVTVHIPTDAGTIQDRCSGATIRAGAVTCTFTNSGDGIALGTAGQMTVAWAPAGVLLAGEYSDRITITVTARQ